MEGRGKVGGRPREGWSHVPSRHSDCVYIHGLPPHLGSTYDIFRGNELSATRGTSRRTLKGTTSSRKAQGAWPNRSVRVQASHCTDWLALLRLPARMGTSAEVTPSTRPRFCRHCLASYISNGVRLSGCVSVFRSYCPSLSLCAIHMLSNSSSLLSTLAS